MLDFNFTQDQFLLFFEICFLCACFGFVWVEVLTSTRGLLGWVPRFYPEKLRDKPLMCAKCLSSWLGILIIFCIFVYKWSLGASSVYVYTFLAPFVCMSLVNIISGNNE